jgi:hypothetical protein
MVKREAALGTRTAVLIGRYVLLVENLAGAGGGLEHAERGLAVLIGRVAFEPCEVDAEVL